MVPEGIRETGGVGQRNRGIVSWVSRERLRQKDWLEATLGFLRRKSVKEV